MKQDKSLKFMDFILNAKENMVVQQYGNYLQIFLIIYLFQQ